ncbi:uncharacterized protein LOC123014459 isoform X3 [Tribolium madens]|uniref:uncharacterized protein LOC123014459 isoform X3 n=1 Tax=Tribolium madens TaxID=41895 RepID=UPI001CF72D36|nr:uncharacterized protein LOC123014459 isoform X3 [Tribolium madens]
MATLRLTAIENRSKYVPAKIKLNPNNELFVEKINKNVKVRTMSEIITLTKSQTDFTGSSPKRYTTKCFIKPVTTPVWYTESLFLNIDSSKRKYNEKIYFKEKLLPFRWSESMITEVKTGPKCIYSDLVIPVDDCRDEVHYISLEPQQRSVKSTDL